MELGNGAVAVASTASADSMLQANATLCSDVREDLLDQRRALAERIAQLTKPQLLAFFDAHVAEGGPARRRLATHVFAPAAAPAQLRAEPLPDDFWPPPPDLMDGADGAAEVTV